jgi:uncharacterized membrane protein YhaH (DUF805 family)
MTAPNPYKPPATHVADSIVHSDVVAYEPENGGFFFSTRGRLGRRQYWANGVTTVFLSIVLFGMVAALLNIPWLAPFSKLLVAWSSTVLIARRAHDFGFSGWWAAIYTAVLLVVPPIMVTFGIGQSFAWLTIVLVLLVFGLVPGDRAPNRFGLPQGSRPIEPKSAQREASPGFSVPGTGGE